MSLISVSVQAQVETDTLIRWEDKKLSWNDYTVLPEGKGLEYKAVCPAEILVDLYIPNVTIDVVFLKNKAWAKDTSSVKLLEHEQIHFDIAELHARMIRKEISILNNSNEKDIDVYRNTIEHLFEEWSHLNELFDKDTHHGLYISKQDEWKKTIQNKLKELEFYKK